MRPSISALAWLPKELKEVLPIIAQAGFSAIEGVPGMFGEMPIYEMPKTRLQAEQGYLKEYGIELCAIQSLLFGCIGGHLFSNGEKGRSILHAHLKQVIIAAHHLGAQFLVFGSPKQRTRGHIEPEKATQIATTFFRSIGSIAADYGCTICIEPNAIEYGCDFMITHKEAAEVVEAIASPGIKLQFDLGSFLMNGESATDIAAYSTLIYHAHLSRPHLLALYQDNTQDPWLHNAEIIVPFLRDKAANKFISIEMKALDTSNLHGVENALKILKKLV